MVRRMLLATSNPHKLGEVRAVFGAEAGGSPVELVSLSELGLSVPEPVEDAETFEGNAVLKAQYYAERSGLGCLADDSGLEVDALGGEPGVRSARYSGASGSRAEVDAANNRRLLAALGDRPASERGARFVCAMAWCEPGEPEPRAVVRGTVEGRVLLPGEAADPDAAYRGRGSNGFGYDPLFLRPESGRTTAELSPAQKNAISHRGEAARQMAQRLRGAAPA